MYLTFDLSYMPVAGITGGIRTWLLKSYVLRFVHHQSDERMLISQWDNDLFIVQ